MIEGLHRHLLYELERAGRADTLFLLAGSCFNVLVLFINWNLASDIGRDMRRSLSSSDNLIQPALLVVFMAGSVVVTTACISTLLNSRKTCDALNASLLKIYNDNDLVKYLPDDLHDLGSKRLRLSSIVVGGTGLLTLLVPLTILTMA